MAHSLSVEQLEQILQEARQDEPSTTELSTYKRLFRDTIKTESSALTQFVQWLTASLIWDSREEPMLLGMRSANNDHYRLRYSAGPATIELAIESSGHSRHMEGEIYTNDEQSDLLRDIGPAFITLLHHGKIIAETTSDLDGRFDFADLNAADYAMTFFIGDGARIELVDVTVS